ncbi:two component, sigma54 specific, transcriptional regulator, Fis family [Cystobacter fuscus DSM 2262]|uniref:Two component, sigma54 specific, transcriptional regulator, Fis family n=1 Tax=Cystobacter fuscus (strain ATCC 25194 / DSM 2262 / NBRC 100088 / M29) TaxID=1242864 RepID=S9R5V6_CYSF2|nr:sigma 54-interacting transcriptional regulator [Cystobacter fuscus]EPX64368.1 two component, sigma54 specific, transcriptional regulator, Fis family [Cystobacter fuscus DSM 2262]
MSDTALSTQQDSPGGPVPRRCQLVVIDGPDAGRAVALGSEPVRVGTREGCALRLSDPRVSGEHLEVWAEETGFGVRDLGSRNGTRYEGSRLGEARVRVGATFKLGRSFVRIQARGQPWEVSPSQARRFGELVGESLAMRELFAVLEHVAPTDTTVLVQGETGTGKEGVARALHEASARRKGPFVAVDCGALPEGLVESELFGHVKGAFTGALAARAGAFARARGGTLFLDELAGISPAVQARLLRVLEERRVRPVGGDAEQAVDVRVVAASRVDLSLAVAEGTFRSDLYYRLAVVTLTLPALRQRREDLALLVAELLRRRGFEPGAVRGPGLELLSGHDWPGNVRELRNVLERSLVLSRGAGSFEQLRLSLQPQGTGAELTLRTDLPFAEAKQAVVESFERHYLRDVLARVGGNLSEAARQAGVDRKHLRALARRHGLLSEEPE